MEVVSGDEKLHFEVLSICVSEVQDDFGLFQKCSSSLNTRVEPKCKCYVLFFLNDSMKFYIIYLV